MKLAVALAAVIALTIGIVMIPTMPIPLRVGPPPEKVEANCHYPPGDDDKYHWTTLPYCDPQPADMRPHKSGLRVAVEGRLRWLGL